MSLAVMGTVSNTVCLFLSLRSDLSLVVCCSFHHSKHFRWSFEPCCNLGYYGDWSHEICQRLGLHIFTNLWCMFWYTHGGKYTYHGLH